LLPRGNSRKQAAATAEQQGNRLSQQERINLSAEAEEAANNRPIGWPKQDCCGLTIWLWGNLRGTAVMHRGIGTHEGEAVWQGEDELEEGLGFEEGQRSPMQSRLRATQQLKDEQVGQTRSRTKAARTQATPSARTHEQQ